VELLKVLILPSSAEFLNVETLSAATGSELNWIRPLLQVPLWIEEVHQQESALVSTLRDQFDPRTCEIAIWNSDKLRFSLGGWSSSKVHFREAVDLKLLKPASHRPPILGAPGGMNCQVSC